MTENGIESISAINKKVLSMDSMVLDISANREEGDTIEPSSEVKEKQEGMQLFHVYQFENEDSYSITFQCYFEITYMDEMGNKKKQDIELSFDKKIDVS